MIKDLFSVPLYKETISISQDETDFIFNYRNIDVKNKPENYNTNSQGNYGTYKSTVLEIPELFNIKKQIENHITRYSNEVLGLHLDYVRLNITQSWINYNDKDTSHHTHSHANSIVSGVIYITDNPADIIFYRSPRNTELEPPLKTLTLYNSDLYSVSIDRNDIILFPSNIMHGVDTNKDDHVRISLSFNTFYKGKLGKDTLKTYLEII